MHCVMRKREDVYMQFSLTQFSISSSLDRHFYMAFSTPSSTHHGSRASFPYDDRVPGHWFEVLIG
jgi:hypothetical protein